MSERECEGCKWYVAFASMCRHEDSTECLGNGPHYRGAGWMREKGWCGPAGKLFEPREEGK